MSTNQGSTGNVAPTSRDQRDIEADIAKLVDAVSAIVSSMQPKDLQPKKRTWYHYDEESPGLQMFYPNSKETRKHLLDVFLSIFLRDEEGNAVFGDHALALKKRERYQDTLDIPSFADQLTLRLVNKLETQERPDGTKDFDSSQRCKDAGGLKDYLMSRVQWDKKLVTLKKYPDGTINDGVWNWWVPKDGTFKLYLPSENEQQIKWELSGGRVSVMESLGTTKRPIETFGYGAIVVLQVPIKDGIIPLKWVQTILAQAGFMHYSSWEAGAKKMYRIHLGSFMNFLGTFAGNWSSRNERSHFLYRPAYFGLLTGPPFVLAQLHFRCLTVDELTKDAIEQEAEMDGLVCRREQAEISSLALGVATRRFKERNVSIFGALSTQLHHASFAYRAIYRVTMLLEVGTKLPDISNMREKFTWHPDLNLEGAIAFQTAVIAATSVWESEWAYTLDKIDECVQFNLSQTKDPTQISEWMFDLGFKRSSLYFTLLQVLRIFGEYIRTVSEDLKTLNGLFLNSTNGIPLLDPSPDELSIIEANWKLVIQTQKEAEERLLGRISDKTEEVKSLRDGIFNATSLREANRGTEMNRYVLVFTVATIIFLPPTFTSTVFALDFFKNKDTNQNIKNYKITTVVMSLITYLLAFVAILAIYLKNNKGIHSIKERLHKLRHSTKDSKTEDKDNKLDKDKNQEKDKNQDKTKNQDQDKNQDKDKDQVVGVTANNTPPAGTTAAASGEAPPHEDPLPTVARDLESGTTADSTTATVKKRSRFVSMLSRTGSRQRNKDEQVSEQARD